MTVALLGERVQVHPDHQLDIIEDHDEKATHKFSSSSIDGVRPMEVYRDILRPVEYVGREMPYSLNIHQREEGDASDEDGVTSISLSLRGSFTFQAKGVPRHSSFSPPCLFHSFLPLFPLATHRVLQAVLRVFFLSDSPPTLIYFVISNIFVSTLLIKV